jgi:hypothetical protein
MLTYFETEDAIVTISDEAQRLYDAEQRDPNQDQQRADIFMWTLVAGIVAIAVLMIRHLVEN